MYNNKQARKEVPLFSTIPFIVYPFNGESLIGYTLRLDYINSFQPGTLLKKYLGLKDISVFFRKDIVEYIETNFDYMSFATDINIPRIVESISLKFKADKKYKFNDFMINNFLYMTELKICPVCIRNWEIPAVFLVKGVDMCLLHKTRLIKQCECGEKITLYSIISGLCCKSSKCKTPLLELITVIDNGKIEERNRMEQLNYGFLMQS